MRAGLTRQGRGVVPCAKRRQGLRGLSKKLRAAGVFGKENPGVGRSDVSVFLRWRTVKISSEHNLLPQRYVPGRRLLGDGKVLDRCVARQRGNGKWREKGNEGWGRVLMAIAPTGGELGPVHFLFCKEFPVQPLPHWLPLRITSILSRYETRALGVIVGAYLTDSSQREERGHGSGSREIRPLYHL